MATKIVKKLFLAAVLCFLQILTSTALATDVIIGEFSADGYNFDILGTIGAGNKISIPHQTFSVPNVFTADMTGGIIPATQPDPHNAIIGPSFYINHSLSNLSNSKIYASYTIGPFPDFSILNVPRNFTYKVLKHASVVYIDADYNNQYDCGFGFDEFGAFRASTNVLWGNINRNWYRIYGPIGLPPKDISINGFDVVSQYDVIRVSGDAKYFCTPVPSSIILFCSGFLGLVGWRRHKKN